MGDKAFTGTYAAIRVTVPEKKLSSYKTILLAKGLSSKAVFNK